MGGRKMKANNKARIEVLARSENIGFVRMSVATFASQLDFTLGELEEIKVAVSEGISNSVLHAYPGKEEGMVFIELEIDGDTLYLTIEDRGQGIEDPEEVLEPAYSSSDRMGLGFAFIKSFMDSFELQSSPGKGVLLRMERSAGVKDRAKSEED